MAKTKAKTKKKTVDRYRIEFFNPTSKRWEIGSVMYFHTKGLTLKRAEEYLANPKWTKYRKVKIG